MVQAIVFLPLLGAILAGLISLIGAHARCPSGDTVQHDGDVHAHDAHGSAPIGGDASVVHVAHHEPMDHGGHGHDDHNAPAEPAAWGSRPAELITTGLLFVAAALSWFALVDIGFLHHDARIALFPWINSGDLQVAWALRADTLTAVMLVVVCGGCMDIAVRIVVMLDRVAAGIAGMRADQRDQTRQNRAQQGQEYDCLDHRLISPSSD